MFVSRAFLLLLLVATPHSSTVSVTYLHQLAEREKFRGPDVNTSCTFVNGESVIRALNESNTVFIPFVLDPYGGLAPLARRLLDGTNLPSSLHFTSPTSQLAYANAASASAPSAILARADKSWAHTCPHIPFGDTYHGWFPSTWARQVFGLNVMFAATSHLYRSIHAPCSRKRPASVPPYPLALGRVSRRVPALLSSVKTTRSIGSPRVLIPL